MYLFRHIWNNEPIIICVHRELANKREHVLQNSDFCLSIDSKNSKLINKINEINKNIQNGNPTIPSILVDELECNIFLRSDNIEIQKQLGVNRGNPIETFSKLRDLKDNF